MNDSHHAEFAVTLLLETGMTNRSRIVGIAAVPPESRGRRLHRQVDGDRRLAAGNDVGQAVAVDGAAVYVTGFTNIAFPGQTSSGAQDVFLVAFDKGVNAPPPINTVPAAR